MNRWWNKTIPQLCNDINWYALMQAILATILIIIAVPLLGVGIIYLCVWLILHPVIGGILFFGSIITSLIITLYHEFN